MNSFLRIYFLRPVLLFAVLLMVTAGENVMAQVNFDVICPQKKIGEQDLLEIQFKVENARQVSSVTPPRFNNFRIVSGPNQQSGMTSINGKIDQYIAIGFTLQPMKTGRFTVKEATAVADGKTYKTKPFTIEVVDGSLSPSPGSNALSPFGNFGFDMPSRPKYQFDDYILKEGDDVNKKISNNLFIKLDVSKTSCYVGEAITASYKLYTRLRSETSISSAPSFNGFSVSDLDVDGQVATEKIDGRPFNVYVLRKVLLYPMHAGEIKMDPLVSNNRVTFIKEDYARRQPGDMFFDMMQNFADANSPDGSVVEKMVTLQSKPVAIQVKPLPTTNEPAGYKGAVGHFSIDASMNKNVITTDDEGLLKVTVSGSGNIQMVNAPKIKWPEGIDGFEARVNESVDKNAVPMKGSKTFTYPFVAEKPGSFTIDSITFSFFDPANNRYTSVKTAPQKISVKQGSGHPASAIVAAQQKKFDKPDGNTTGGLKYWLVGAALVLLAGVLVFARKKKFVRKASPNVAATDKPVVEKEPAAFVIPENPLLAAHEKMRGGEAKEFYQVLAMSLKTYLAGKFGIPQEEMSRKRLFEELDRCNVGLHTTLLLTKLHEAIELNLYAHSADGEQLQAVYEDAAELVSLLDKQVC